MAQPTEGHTDKQSEEQVEGHTKRHTEGHMERHTEGHTEEKGHAGKAIKRSTKWHVERHTAGYTEVAREGIRVSSSASGQPRRKKKGKQTWMDEWCGLAAPDPENQQPTASVAVSKSDNSSLKSIPESVQAPISDKNNDKAAGNSAIMSALSADNTHGKSGALVHRSQRLDDKYKTHNIGKDRPEEQVPNSIK